MSESEPVCPSAWQLHLQLGLGDGTYVGLAPPLWNSIQPVWLFTALWLIMQPAQKHTKVCQIILFLTIHGPLCGSNFGGANVAFELWVFHGPDAFLKKRWCLVLFEMPAQIIDASGSHAVVNHQLFRTSLEWILNEWQFDNSKTHTVKQSNRLRLTLYKSDVGLLLDFDWLWSWLISDYSELNWIALTSFANKNEPFSWIEPNLSFSLTISWLLNIRRPCRHRLQFKVQSSTGPQVHSN